MRRRPRAADSSGASAGVSWRRAPACSAQSSTGPVRVGEAHVRRADRREALLPLRRDVEHPGADRAAQPLLAGGGVERRTPSAATSTGIAPAPCAPSSSTGTSAGTPSSDGHDVAAQPADVRARDELRLRPTAPAISASGTARTRRRRGASRAASSGPSRPGCSASLVRISSPRPSSSPATTRTMPVARRGRRARRRRPARRARARRPRAGWACRPCMRSKYGIAPPVALAEVVDLLERGPRGRRGSGPHVPAFR